MSTPSSDTKWKKRINRPFYIAATLSVMLFVLVGCGPSVESVERTTDQNKLAKIVVEAKDWHVRIAAVHKLTDQALLEKIAAEDKDVNVRKAAVYKLTDQALLEKIAVEDKDVNVRKSAVHKLTSLAWREKIVAEEKEMNKRIRTEPSGARNGIPAARNQ